MTDTPEVQRRLRLTVQIDADDLDELYRSLNAIAHDVLAEGREYREVQSGGYSSSHSLLLVKAENGVDGDAYRHALSDWMQQRRDGRRRATAGSPS